MTTVSFSGANKNNWQKVKKPQPSRGPKRSAGNGRVSGWKTDLTANCRKTKKGREFLSMLSKRNERGMGKNYREGTSGAVRIRRLNSIPTAIRERRQ